MKDILSLSAAATELGIKPATLRKWADHGKINFFTTAGGHRRFYYSDILDFKAGKQVPMRNHNNKQTQDILIVDDDPDIRFLLSEQLSIEGYQVRTASSATAGILEINKKIPSLMLLDITMPGMDGWVMMQRIREKLSAQELPIIVFSGSSDLNMDKKPGAQKYLSKSISADTLLQQISAVLA